MSYKNVYFHRMLMYKRIIENTDMRKEYKDISELDNKIQFLIDNKLNEFKSLRLEPESTDTIEFIDHDDKYIYARIGRAKDLFTVQLRNPNTLEPSRLDIGPDKQLEIFTYLLIDRTNYIISYLREQSAPSIQRLTCLIDNNFQDENLFGEISSIAIDDAIPLLKRKDIIGTINYKMSIPSDEKLNIDTLGLSEKQYDMLDNLKTVDIEIKLVAERNKDIMRDKNKIGEFFSDIISFAKGIRVKAKNKDEYMQTYNIVDSPLTKRMKFDFDRNANNIENEIKHKLKKLYISNKDEIIRLIR